MESRAHQFHADQVIGIVCRYSDCDFHYFECLKDSGVVISAKKQMMNFIR